jgi:hypothetical protein
VAVKIDANQLAAKYGYAASFFNSNPELKKLLATAVAAQWTPEEFSARFMNTAFYKWSAESQKNWQALVAKNPGEANKRVRDRGADLTAQAARLGITIDPKRLAQMTTWSLMYGWDENATSRAFAAEMKYDPKAAQAGDIGSMQAQIREHAAAYGVQLGDQEVWSMSKKMVEGSVDQEGILEQIKQVAMGRFPGLADEIKRGLSVRELASSYIQAQARILEVDPNQIDLATDPKLQKALQARGDDGKPVAGGMPLWQYEESLKKAPEWLKTKNARSEMNGVASKVLKDFGLVS